MMIAKILIKSRWILIGHKAEVNIRLDDTYPKKINCLGTDITINKFERNDKGLNIEIEVNDSNFSYFGDVMEAIVLKKGIVRIILMSLYLILRKKITIN